MLSRPTITRRARGDRVAPRAGYDPDRRRWFRARDSGSPLGVDSAGTLYATWDTLQPGGDIGWLSYSTDGGASWSAPLRVTPDTDNAVHNVEVAGAGPGTADVAWQADNSPQGYATYLRPFSIGAGWLGPVTRVSTQYGNTAIWPGDTFGLSVLPGALSPLGPERVSLSWGSAVGGSQDSEIYAAVASRQG